MPSTDFLAIIDPPARIDCCDPGCKPTPVNTQATAAVLAEQHDEWTEMRRYIGVDVLAKARLQLVPDNAADDTAQEVTPAAITA